MKESAFSVFINGLLTGLLLQTAVGPVFFYVFNITVQKGWKHGAAAVAAVTIADYIYITLAAAGVGRLLEKDRVKKISGIIGALVLTIFGTIMLLSAWKTAAGGEPAVTTGDWPSSFLSAFFLTVSSPLTIIFWTGLFAAKASEKNYSRKQLVLFGLSAGSATLLFLGTSVAVFSLTKTFIPPIVVKILNITVGALLVVYGIIRFLKVFKKVSKIPNK